MAAPLLSQINEAFWLLLDPWIFMSFSLYYLPGTILRLIREGDYRSLTSWKHFQPAWFGAFWSWAGPQVRQTGERRVLPLLDGRVHAGAVTESAMHTPVGGVVIEVGAGSGMWVSVFKDRDKETSGSGTGVAEGAGEVARRRGGPGKVTKVYGVEPNKDVHAELYQRVRDAGLEDTYEVVPVGIESLGDATKWHGKIEKESVDCIVSILCLCSIPDPEKNIKELYGYLKKGGRWYVYEHVQVHDNLPMKLYQGMYSRRLL
jgi:ubiquinone/menaquinone biosynthesis C-methylase UbiE